MGSSFQKLISFNSSRLSWLLSSIHAAPTVADRRPDTVKLDDTLRFEDKKTTGRRFAGRQGRFEASEGEVAHQGVLLRMSCAPPERPGGKCGINLVSYLRGFTQPATPARGRCHDSVLLPCKLHQPLGSRLGKAVGRCHRCDGTLVFLLFLVFLVFLVFFDEGAETISTTQNSQRGVFHAGQHRCQLHMTGISVARFDMSRSLQSSQGPQL